MNLAQKKQAVIDRISAMTDNEFEELLMDAPHLIDDIEEGFDCGWEDEDEEDLDDEIEDDEDDADYEADTFAEEGDDDDFFDEEDEEDNVVPLRRVHDWE